MNEPRQTSPKESHSPGAPDYSVLPVIIDIVDYVHIVYIVYVEIHVDPGPDPRFPQGARGTWVRPL